MAFGPSGGGGGRFSGRRTNYRPMSDINVTPLVDVMLVLLVVFMITAPLLTAGVPVDLPKTNASEIIGQDEPLTVTVDGTGKLFIQEAGIALEELVPKLEAITSAKRDTRIFVRGDRNIQYGKVMEVMGLINQAGFTRVALLTEMPGSSPPADRRPAPPRR
jgi:biopolymer transport protein TolR